VHPLPSGPPVKNTAEQEAPPAKDQQCVAQTLFNPADWAEMTKAC